MARGIEIHNGQIVIGTPDDPLRHLLVRKEVKEATDYAFNRIMTISGEGMALVDQAFSGLVVMGILEKGSLSGGLAIFSGLHVWALAYDEGEFLGGAWGCIVALQYHPASTVDLRHGVWIQHSIAGRTIQSAIMIDLANVGTVTHVIELSGGNWTNFAKLPDDGNIASDSETPSVEAGWIKYLVGSTTLYSKLYSTAPA